MNIGSYFCLLLDRWHSITRTNEDYCQFSPWEHTLVKFELKYIDRHPKKAFEIPPAKLPVILSRAHCVNENRTRPVTFEINHQLLYSCQPMIFIRDNENNCIGITHFLVIMIAFWHVLVELPQTNICVKKCLFTQDIVNMTRGLDTSTPILFLYKRNKC